jgi:hypothetical protein
MSIHSGHGTGKDAFASWVILHYLITALYPKVICTAPTDSQLRSILWSEIHKWMRGSIIKEALVYQAEKIYLRDAGGKEWFAIPRTISTNQTEDDQAETLAGFHEDYLLYIIDEASGVPDAVRKPLEGSLTGRCNVVLEIGNPTKSSGAFFDTHNKYRSEWIPLRWNAEESEIVGVDQINRMREKYGIESNAYRVRVLGLPPTASPDSLVPWDWLVAASERDLESAIDDPLAVGVDVARFGDDSSVITACRGMVTADIREYKKLGGVEVAEWTQNVIAEHATDEAVYGVGIDIIGVGASVFDHLNRFSTIQYLYPVNVAETPAINPDRFERLRDEILWRVRDEFQAGIVKIPAHSDLMHECNEIKWAVQPSGKIKIESKKELKKRGQASPNFLDSYAIARYVRTMLSSIPSSFRKCRSHRQTGSTWATGALAGLLICG